VEPGPLPLPKSGGFPSPVRMASWYRSLSPSFRVFSFFFPSELLPVSSSLRGDASGRALIPFSPVLSDRADFFFLPNNGQLFPLVKGSTFVPFPSFPFRCKFHFVKGKTWLLLPFSFSPPGCPFRGDAFVKREKSYDPVRFFFPPVFAGGMRPFSFEQSERSGGFSLGQGKGRPRFVSHQSLSFFPFSSRDPFFRKWKFDLS